MSGGNLSGVYNFYTMAVTAATMVRTSVSKTHVRVSVLRMKFKG